MLVNSRQTINDLEQQKVNLEKDLKMLINTNLSLKETNDRLLVVNDTQQMMLSQYDQSLSKSRLSQVLTQSL